MTVPSVLVLFLVLQFKGLKACQADERQFMDSCVHLAENGGLVRPQPGLLSKNFNSVTRMGVCRVYGVYAYHNGYI